MEFVGHSSEFAPFIARAEEEEELLLLRLCCGAFLLAGGNRAGEGQAALAAGWEVVAHR